MDNAKILSTPKNSSVSSISVSKLPTFATVDKSDGLTNDLSTLSDEFFLNVIPSTSTTSTIGFSSLCKNTSTPVSKTIVVKQPKVSTELLKVSDDKPSIDKGAEQSARIEHSQQLEPDEETPSSSELSAKGQIKNLVIKTLTKFTRWDLLVSLVRLIVTIFMIRGIVVGSSHSDECPAAAVLPVAVVFGCSTMLFYICLDLTVEYAGLPYDANTYITVKNIFVVLVVTNIFIATYYTILNPPKLLIAETEPKPAELGGYCAMPLFLMSYGYVCVIHTIVSIAVFLLLAMTYLDLAAVDGWLKKSKFGWCRCVRRRR